MSRLSKIFLIFCFVSTAKAQQNLVPNWSFESISSCPNCTGTTTSTLSTGWQNPNNGSSDLFSNCDTQICAGWNVACNGVPSNCWGWQNPHSGNNYVGFAVYGSSQINAREYVQVKLKDTLQINKKYCVSFYTSRADSFSRYATSRLGCYISQTSITNFSQNLISVNPQIENTYNNFLTDKISWTEIKGLINATGGENYITIGNFFDDVNTDTVSEIGFRFGSTASYYYVDDVSLTEYSLANAGKDTNICTEIKINVAPTFGAQYNWSVISGDANSIDSANASSPTLTPAVTTTYVLQKQQCGIISYDTLLVGVSTNYPPIKVGNDTTICAGVTITGNVVPIPQAQYNWSIITGDPNSIDSFNIAAPIFSPSITTTYVIQKKQCNVFSYDTVTIYIPKNYPALLGSDTTVCVEDSITLFAVNNCPWCNHHWSNGATSMQIMVNPQSASTYQFYQTDSCRTTSDAIAVNVDYCKSPVIIGPNVFTPNGDDINEVWLPQIKNELSISYYSLTIYDRWGLKIFETNKYAEGWDGHTTSGIECVEGTYYFVIEYSEVKASKNTTLKGFLELISKTK